MVMITCPYCSMEVNEDEVETEDGCCPECGAMITAGSLFFDADDNDDDNLKDSDDYLDFPEDDD